MRKLATLCYPRERSFLDHAGPDLILENDPVQGLTLALPLNYIIDYTVRLRDLHDTIAKFTIHPSSIMSIAQGLCLQSCIAKKLRRDKNCLRKSIAHKSLRQKLQPFVMKAEERQLMDEEELDPATDEACSWLKMEWKTGMASFERVAMGTERLAAITLHDNGEEYGHLI